MEERRKEGTKERNPSVRRPRRIENKSQLATLQDQYGQETKMLKNWVNGRRTDLARCGLARCRMYRRYVGMYVKSRTLARSRLR